MDKIPAGAAGSGFTNSSAGLILVALVIGILFAIDPVREAMADLWKQLVSYFMGPSTDENARNEQHAEPTDQTNSASIRESEKDAYNFDLSILAIGDDPGPSNGPS